MAQASAATAAGGNQMRAVLAAAIAAVVAAIVTGMTQFAAAVQSGRRRAVASANSAAAGIKAAFTFSLASQGANIIQTFANGMISRIGAVTAAAARAAAAIKAQFPASPAKEGPLSGRGDPIFSGQETMNRYADGIPVVATAAAAAAGAVTSSLTGVRVAAPTLAASSNPILSTGGRSGDTALLNRILARADTTTRAAGTGAATPTTTDSPTAGTTVNNYVDVSFPSMLPADPAVKCNAVARINDNLRGYQRGRT